LPVDFADMGARTGSKRKVIGGVFGLESEVGGAVGPVPFLGGGPRLLGNARSGIWMVVQQTRPGQIWMPSYLCSSMLDGVPDRARVRYYDVDDTLRVTDPRWIEQVDHDDLVVFIDYFGFPADRQSLGAAKTRGAWVLEDACQAMLTEQVGEAADFVLYSPRKFFGVPDGGILTARSDLPASDVPLQKLPEDWWLTSWRSTLFRRDFDRGADRRDWFDLFRQAEASVPVGPYAMSELASALVSRVDASAVARRRRENYALLLERLASCALFPRLPDGVVPLGFPIRTSRRDAVRQRLFAEDIFPPVHWPIGDVVPPAHQHSHRLSAEIMTLPCDQRYDRDDMNRIAEATARALHEEST